MTKSTEWRPVQENIKRKKQDERAAERFKHWLHHPLADHDYLASKMAGYWGTVLDTDDIYNIEPIDYQIMDHGISKADRYVIDLVDGGFEIEQVNYEDFKALHNAKKQK